MTNAQREHVSDNRVGTPPSSTFSVTSVLALHQKSFMYNLRDCQSTRCNLLALSKTLRGSSRSSPISKVCAHLYPCLRVRLRSLYTPQVIGESTKAATASLSELSGVPPWNSLPTNLRSKLGCCRVSWPWHRGTKELLKHCRLSTLSDKCVATRDRNFSSSAARGSVLTSMKPTSVRGHVAPGFQSLTLTFSALPLLGSGTKTPSPAGKCIVCRFFCIRCCIHATADAPTTKPTGPRHAPNAPPTAKPPMAFGRCCGPAE